MSTSAADFLHILLHGGQELVMAKKRRGKSSFLDSSCAGPGWLHNLTNTYSTKNCINIIFLYCLIKFNVVYSHT